LEYLLRCEVINASVEFGDYDNIVQDSQKYKDTNSVIIFWELCNIIDGLQYKIELLNKNKKIIKILEHKLKSIENSNHKIFVPNNNRKYFKNNLIRKTF